MKPLGIYILNFAFDTDCHAFHLSSLALDTQNNTRISIPCVSIAMNCSICIRRLQILQLATSWFLNDFYSILLFTGEQYSKVWLRTVIGTPKMHEFLNFAKSITLNHHLINGVQLRRHLSLPDFLAVLNLIRPLKGSTWTLLVAESFHLVFNLEIFHQKFMFYILTEFSYSITLLATSSVSSLYFGFWALDSFDRSTWSGSENGNCGWEKM